MAKLKLQKKKQGEVIVQARVSTELADQIKAFAEKNQTFVSEVVRSGIELALKYGGEDIKLYKSR